MMSRRAANGRGNGKDGQETAAADGKSRRKLNEPDTSVEKRCKIIRKITDIHKDAVGKGIGRNTLHTLLLEGVKNSHTNDCNIKDEKPSLKASTGVANKLKSRKCLALILVPIVIVFAIFGAIIVAYEVQSFEDLLGVKDDFFMNRCLVDNNGFMIEVARPLVRCSMCETLHEVPIERNISLEQFKERYAYSGIPVLVKDATVNWTAMTSFSFNFFKEMYNDIDGALVEVEEECQFFPYKTSFTTLAQVLNMSEARATFQPGEQPWYIGWSNCNKEVQMRLREHYQRPYFLPNDSESSVIDWMFMGGSGPGAFIHLDYVQRPSWQAQISGRKTWSLVPAPECESVCRSMNVTVEKGDIFVIDTNVWYHATYIHPGEISITIGSEYD